MFYDEWLTRHRHLLLKEAGTMNVSCERLFSIPTAKVFPIECFVSYRYVVYCLLCHRE